MNFSDLPMVDYVFSAKIVNQARIGILKKHVLIILYLTAVKSN